MSEQLCHRCFGSFGADNYGNLELIRSIERATRALHGARVHEPLVSCRVLVNEAGGLRIITGKAHKHPFWDVRDHSLGV